MLPVLLLVGVVAGIAWPFLRGKNGLLQRRTAAAASHANEARRPAAHEELCPHCGKVNYPGATLCVDCGGHMLLDNVSGLWQGDERQELIREGAQIGVLFAGMILAVTLSSWLPMAGKLLVVIATIAILSWRFLRLISD